jgi:hypothetical protein
LQVAAPIHPQQRGAFLQALAGELEKHPVVGPGLVHRCAAALQKTFVVAAHSETLEDARAAPGGALSRRSSALEHYGAAAIYRFVERPGCFRIGQRWSPQRKHRIGVAGMQLLQVSRPPYVASVLTRRQILAVT